VGIDENEALVERFYREVINERRVDAIDELLAEDFVHNGEQRGRAGQKQGVQAFLAGFDPLTDTIEFMLAEDDLVCARQRWTGKHVGEFLGVAATGREVQFTTTAVLRIAGAEIAEAWDEGDYLGLLGQLGARPGG